MLISQNWADALDPLVRYWFDLGERRPPSMLQTLFNVQGSMRSYEQASGIGSVGIEAWESYEAGDGVGQADFDQGYKTTFTHSEYPLEIPVKRKLIDDNMIGLVQRNISKMGTSAAIKRETDAASVFNNAFDATNHALADGQSLCDGAHPYSADKPNSTQNNSFTLALTLPNVRTIRETMMKYTDDTGNKLGIVPDTILVPIDLQDDALPIAGSPLDPTSGNNAINPQQGRWNVLTWHYLTDTNAWFMIDSMAMRDMLLWFNRVPLTINPKVEDKTIQATWIAYMRYSFGAAGWQWIAGSNPS